MRLTKLLVLTLSAVILCGGTVLAASEQITTESPSEGITTPGGTSGPKNVKPPQPAVPLANLTFACPSGKSFKISTGTGSGSCRITANSNGTITGGKCVSSGGKEVALVVCGGAEGGTCDSTSGSGSCSPVN